MELIDRNKLIVQLSDLGLQAVFLENQKEADVIDKCISVVESQPIYEED